MSVRRTLMSSWRRLTMRPFWQAVSMVMLSFSAAMFVYAAAEPSSAEALSAHDLKLIGLLFAAVMGSFALEARVSKRIVVPTALMVVNDRLEKHLSTDHKTLMEKLDELIREIRADRDRSDGEIKDLAERLSRLEGAHNEQHGGGKR
jgi:hypothetical protein